MSRRLSWQYWRSSSRITAWTGVNRVLATLLFTDIVGSTQTAAQLGDREWNVVLETHRDIVRSELQRAGGREIGTTGDGFVAMFDGPERAVRCALTIIGSLGAIGVSIRAGVHKSEVEVAGGDVAGLGVHVAARIMSLAEPGEVLVSTVVRDLALGSGLLSAIGDAIRSRASPVSGSCSPRRLVTTRPRRPTSDPGRRCTTAFDASMDPALDEVYLAAVGSSTKLIPQQLADGVARQPDDERDRRRGHVGRGAGPCRTPRALPPSRRFRR